jgi:hypothetical protein
VGDGASITQRNVRYSAKPVAKKLTPAKARSGGEEALPKPEEGFSKPGGSYFQAKGREIQAYSFHQVRLFKELPEQLFSRRFRGSKIILGLCNMPAPPASAAGQRTLAPFSV